LAEAAVPNAGHGRLAETSLRRLHRAAIMDRPSIRRVLERAITQGVTLRNGVDRRNAERTARLTLVEDSSITLLVQNISARQIQLFLNFDCDGVGYFFATRVLAEHGDRIVAQFPATLYEAERRDLRRISVDSPTSPHRLAIENPLGTSQPAELRDWSYDGLGIAVPSNGAPDRGAQVAVRFIDGFRSGSRANAVVKNTAPDTQLSGWTRVGLSVSAVPVAERIQPETRARIVPSGSSAWQRIVLAGHPVRSARQRLAKRLGLKRDPRVPNLVEFRNDVGQRIAGFLDRTAEHCSTAVVIPPSWGRTKETFLPLAKTLLRMFSADGEDVAVLRFDGTNRRGESYVDPAFRQAGSDYLGFTFSQAVSDIHSSVSYLRESVRPRRVVLVTFSLAAIEGRRAVATDPTGSISGWISVVGMPDLQSGLRTVSGGVDYAHGLLQGVEFGVHELVGVLADMDRTGTDALRHNLVFLEDARRDMANVSIPVTWLHGRHDGWIDIERVATLLSSGDLSRRRLLEIPTGHELRTSLEALETFQLVTSEVARIALDKPLKPLLPDLLELEQDRLAERRRRPVPQLNSKTFWHDYLVGKHGDGGMQILAATSSYRRFMADQIAALSVPNDSHVVDLGSGLGEFANSIERSDVSAQPAWITEVDLVATTLRRSRATSTDRHHRRFRVSRVAADLDLGNNSIPLRTGSVDAVLASLVISYLSDPLALLRDVHRILAPRGRFVVSTMRKDADISRIHAEGVAELEATAPRDSEVAIDGSGSLESLQREFLNSASRLVDLEESGRFRFYDASEVSDLLRAAGFSDIVLTRSFGDPSQAIVASCRRL
jgi:SAM-dependent methyltransferase